MKLPRLWRSRYRNAPTQPHEIDLSSPVCWLSADDAVTIGNLCEGCIIFGATGAGKTSGPLRTLLKRLLRKKVGGIFLCAKPDDAANYRALCIEAGRESDFIHWYPGSGHTCDVLDYELQQKGGTVESASQLIETLIEVANRSAAPQGGGDQVFWQMSAQRVIRNAIIAIYRATGHCSLSDIHRFLMACPTTPGQAADKTRDATSHAAKCLREATLKADTPDKMRDVGSAADFFYDEWPNLSDKTRSVILTIVQNITSKFVSGPLAKMISSGATNTPPDLPQSGKLICLDMPVLVWRELGQWFQVMIKLLVARATLRRDVKQSPLPVFCCADEFQLFTAEQDGTNQTVARSQRYMSIAATQSIPVFVSAMGGSEKARMEVLGLIANHQLKIFAQTACSETSRFASEMFGHTRKLFFSASQQHEPYDMVDDLLGFDTSRASGSMSEQWHPCVPPHAFATLRKGGEANGYMVDAFVFQGRRWSNGKTFMKVEFNQRG